MEDVSALLARWHLTPADAREQIYWAKTARERERWHALWSLSCGGPAAQVAQALERDPHTIGDWLTAFAQDGPPALACEQSGGSPPPSSQSSKPRLQAAVEGAPASAGIPLANWTRAGRSAVPAGPWGPGTESNQLPALATSARLHLEATSRNAYSKPQHRNARRSCGSRRN